MSKEDNGPNPVDVHVGSRMRLKRTMMGMSQEKLGEKLGVTFQQVQKYEKGTNRISASRLFQLTNILNAPVSFFYDGVHGESKSASGFAEEGSTDFAMDLLNDPETLQLYRAFSSVKDPKIRRRIVDLVKSIADDTTDA